MIKLTPLLTEVTKRSQQLRKPLFMAALTRGQFRSAYNKMLEKREIFRGVSGSAAYPYWIVQPGKSQRVSRNTSNFYTGLIDGLPSWKNYPKRSRSIICSNNYDGAHSFGNVLRVFPKNGAKIGICPAEDFWMSFNDTVHKRLGLADMSFFNAYFISIFFACSGTLADMAAKLDEDTYSEFIKKLNGKIDIKLYISAIRYQEKMDKLPYGVDGKRLIDDAENYFRGNWEQYFDDLLDSERNGFQVQTIENYTRTETSYNEVWTDATSLMLSYNASQELLQSPTNIKLPKQPGEPDLSGIEI